MLTSIDLSKGSLTTAQMNLEAIRSSLEQTQALFKDINRTLNVRRAPMSDEVVHNMMEGYTFVASSLSRGVDLLALGSSQQLLELNSLVLLGSNQSNRDAFESHIKHSHSHFYETVDGGIGSLMEWHQRHRDDNLWHKVAGLYIQILSQPQLFIEGNHRTAILLISFLLVREGYPPFVLTPNNAKRLLDRSKGIGNLRKHSLAMWFQFSSKRERLAQIFKTGLDPRHLIVS